MKQAVIILFILVNSNAIYSQSEIIQGTYQLESNATNANLKRTLILNSDGTFLFHNYEYHDAGIPPEKNNYGKGTWTSEKKVIYFYNTPSDLDKIHTLSFNNTKARFDTKPPRDTSDRIVKTSLRFYESDIFWIKGDTLVKVE